MDVNANLFGQVGTAGMAFDLITEIFFERFFDVKFFEASGATINFFQEFFLVRNQLAGLVFDLNIRVERGLKQIFAVVLVSLGGEKVDITGGSRSQIEDAEGVRRIQQARDFADAAGAAQAVAKRSRTKAHA